VAERDRDADPAARGPVREYASGEIRSYEGRVNRWLLLLYAVLTAWAVYYLIRYWAAS